MLQRVWRMRIPMKRPATPYEKQPKGKKKKRGVSYKCPRSRSAREGGLGYSLLVCVILPCSPNQVGSTSGPPLRRPGPCHDASLSPLAGPKTHASGEGCASECVGKRPILEKNKTKKRQRAGTDADADAAGSHAWLCCSYVLAPRTTWFNVSRLVGGIYSSGAHSTNGLLTALTALTAPAYRR